MSRDDSTPQPSPWRVESSGDDSTPPSTPWRTLPGFSSTPEASRPPSSHSTPWGSGPTTEASRPPEFPPTPQGSSLYQPRRPPFSPSCCVCAPWRLHVSPPSAVPEVVFLPPLPPAFTPIYILRAPISCVTHCDAVRGAGSSSPSSESASDVPSLLPLSPLHPSLSSPPAPPLPTSLVALQPLAPANAPLPPAPAAYISLRDEEVGDRTGGVVARRSLAGGSAPRGKCPRSPRVVVGDSISRFLFLHLPQQWHPVHCLPAFLHSHALADGPVVEQVK